jgi:hypothetical protein
VLKRSQKLGQTLGYTTYNITTVAIFWEQEWELQFSLLFKPNLPSIRASQFICHIFCHLQSTKLCTQSGKSRYMLLLQEGFVTNTTNIQNNEMKSSAQVPQHRAVLTSC